MSKSMIIIGAGIAGLSAGCYARMNGFESTIFELHSQAGGLCTSWKRKGYTFDGCIHWLVGTNPESSINVIWKELGALQDAKIYDPAEIMRYESVDGKTYIAYTDLYQLEKEMLRLSPQDEKAIREFIADALLFAHFGNVMPSPGRLPPISKLGGLMLYGIPAMLKMRKYSKVTVQDYAKRFNDAFLRRAFVAQMDMPDFPMAAVFMTIGWRHTKDAGYPLGGSLPFAQAIEKRYLALGGNLRYNARVEKILISDGRALGVRLEDGSEYFADHIVSAADGYATHFKLLGEEFLTDEVRSYYQNMPIFPPVIQVSLGVAMDTSTIPDFLQMELEEPLSIAGEVQRSLSFRNFRFDPSLAPAAKSVIVCLIESNYAYWKELAEDSERYETEKKEVALKVMGVLDKRFAGISKNIEIVDVATPLTYERYTGNWQGSMEGWLLTRKSYPFLMDGKGMAKTLPAVQNFTLCGQWVEPGGGIPTAAMSARGAIQKICKQEKCKFVTSEV